MTIVRLAVAALVVAAAVLDASTALAADTVDGTIAEIKKHKKAGDSLKALPLIKAVAETDDPRVRTFLRDLTSDPDDVYACAAYEQVGTHKDAEFLGTMRIRADDKKLPTERPAVYTALLDAFVALADESKPTHDVLSDVVQKQLPLNAEFATRAVRAYAVVRDKYTVDKLIVWLVQADSTGGPNVAGATNPSTLAAYEKEKPVLLECLRSLTGMSLVTVLEWRAWWKERKADFKCPPPPKK